MDIIWTTPAQRQLNSIFDYILQHNPHAALNVYENIKEAVETLATHPHLGRPGCLENTRELIMPDFPYIIAYRIHYQQLEVLAVMHTARDWPDA